MSKLTLILITLIAASLTVRAIPAGDVHFVVSVYQDESSSARVISAFEQLAAAAPVGAHIVLWNGNSAAAFHELNVPTRHETIPSLKKKEQKPVADAAAVLSRTLRESKPADPFPPYAFNSIDTPKVLAAIAHRGASPGTLIILAGSPLFYSGSEPKFSMAPPLYPLDFNLRSSIETTPYSVVGREQSLANISVQWLIPAGFCFANPMHEHRVRRFWALYLSLQGAQLQNMAAEWENLVSHLWDPDRPRRPLFEAASLVLELGTSKIGLVPALPREPVTEPPPPRAIPVEPPPHSSSTNAAVSEGPETVVRQPQVPAQQEVTEISPVAAPAEPPALPVAPATISRSTIEPMIRLYRKGTVGVAICWPQDADVDLWVQPDPASPDEISFKYPKSKRGKLASGDIRHANQSEIFEFIEIDASVAPVDLGTLSIWVDYYKGSAVVITGQVVVFAGDEVLVGDFSINAPYGDQARDRAPQHRRTSRYWTAIDVNRLQPLPNGGQLTARLPQS